MGIDEIVKIEPKAKKKTMSITVDPRVINDFKKIAKTKGVSASMAIEALMRAYIEANQKLL